MLFSDWSEPMTSHEGLVMSRRVHHDAGHKVHAGVADTGVSGTVLPCIVATSVRYRS